ncbi:EMG1, NEP1 Emg1p [Chlamydoabsidia padenii]|nr:EMG1, NEP1 Emg1p [Chlamydoabsidia padenii]
MEQGTGSIVKMEQGTGSIVKMEQDTGSIVQKEETTVHLTPLKRKASTDETTATPPKRKVIIVLENASLEVARLTVPHHEHKLKLLNCDDHQSVLKRLGRDISEARPDIVHQCLLTLLDSPLNKAGHLEVYIHTSKDVLIRINPECRIPRTMKRFSGLMIKLLESRFIATQNGGKRLLEIIQGPMAKHIPDNAIKLALSWNAPRVKLCNYFKDLDLDERPLVIAIGAMAKGEDTFANSYSDKKIGISKYALSASVACGKVCCALEDLWDVI